MRRTFELFAVSALAGALAAGCCRNSATRENPYVEVTAAAEVEAEADIFMLAIDLNENRTSGSNIGAMEQKMVAALRELDINPDSALTVTGMGGDNWYWWRPSRTVYQNKSYELRVGDMGLLNRACDALDKMGNVNYRLSRLDYSGIDSLKSDVQRSAVALARTRADNLLSGEGAKAGRLLSLLEEPTYENPPYLAKFEATADMGAEASETTVGMRKMKVTCRVVARFTINANK